MGELASIVEANGGDGSALKYFANNTWLGDAPQKPGRDLPYLPYTTARGNA